MSYRTLIKKLEIERKLKRTDGFITSEDLKKICKSSVINLDYNASIGYLLNNGYVERILRGIFYIRTLEEKRDNISKVSFFEAMAKVMRLKKVDKWYFGLESALKLNSLTHETFFVDTIITNKIKNNAPLLVLGHKVKFTKILGIDFSFGIKNKKVGSEVFYYSDPGRTILDIAYIGKYNGKSRTDILREIGDYKTLNIKKYFSKYPKTIKEVFS
jgi:predicted transcriptional regulator of viral defense system